MQRPLVCTAKGERPSPFHVGTNPILSRRSSIARHNNIMNNDRLSLEAISRHVDAKAEDYCSLSDRIWAAPELAFEEHRAVAEQIAMLEREGFRICRMWAAWPPPSSRNGARAARGRHPRRVRRPARPRAGLRRHRTQADHRRYAGPRLRPQPARSGSALGRRRPQRCAGARGHRRHGALLRLPGGGERLRQDLHGARRPVSRSRRRLLLASERRERGADQLVARLHPGLFPLQGPRGACGGGTPCGPFRARCGGADECGRELHARAHALRCARALRHHQYRRQRAERGAGLCRIALSRALAASARCGAPVRAREEDRRGRRADDGDLGHGADHRCHLERAAEQGAAGGHVREHAPPRPAGLRRGRCRLRGKAPARRR